MTNRKIALASALVVASFGTVVSADTGSELEALKARIAQLEAQQQTSAATARELDAAVAGAVSDAQSRSELLMADGFTAGWDKGFKLMSADGLYSAQIYGQFQFRSVTNSNDGIFSDDADVVNGFENRRMKLGVRGNAISKDLTYDFRAAFGRNDGSLELENAFVQYMFQEDMGFRVGQWKGNVAREETISSARQLAAERSLVNEVLAGGITDFVQGAAFLYKADQLRAEIALTDGAGSANTNFTDTNGDFGVEGRVDFLVSGDWKAADDFTAMGTTDQLLVVGAGFDYTVDGDSYTLIHTVDAQFETNGGLSLYGAYVGQFGDTGTGGDDFWNMGFIAQAGYLLPDTQWEVFGRYGLILFDDDVTTGEDTFNELTIGANYYLKGHDAKVTLDLVVLPDGSPGGQSGLGYVGSDDEQYVIRGQFQLLI